MLPSSYECYVTVLIFGFCWCVKIVFFRLRLFEARSRAPMRKGPEVSYGSTCGVHRSKERRDVDASPGRVELVRICTAACFGCFLAVAAKWSSFCLMISISGERPRRVGSPD